MTDTTITEEMIYQCFAAASLGENPTASATSFIDVEEYENQVMYPEFARWAERAGQPALATLFRKVAGEEKRHAVWLRDLYQHIGTPARGEDTHRAISALETIRANCDALIALNPDAVIEKALAVAICVEEREYTDIYPRFRDQALAADNPEAAAVYQRVIDSEQRHAEWFRDAANTLQSNAA